MIAPTVATASYLHRRGVPVHLYTFNHHSPYADEAWWGSYHSVGESPSAPLRRGHTCLRQTERATVNQLSSGLAGLFRLQQSVTDTRTRLC